MTETQYANIRVFNTLFLKYVQTMMNLAKKRPFWGEKVSVSLQTKSFHAIAPVQIGCKFEGKTECKLLGIFNAQCLSKVGFLLFPAIFLAKFLAITISVCAPNFVYATL